MRLVKEEKTSLVKQATCLSKKTIVCLVVAVLLILVGAGVAGAAISVKFHSDTITVKLTELLKVRILLTGFVNYFLRSTQSYQVVLLKI